MKFGGGHKKFEGHGAKICMKYIYIYIYIYDIYISYIYDSKPLGEVQSYNSAASRLCQEHTHKAIQYIYIYIYV